MTPFSIEMGPIKIGEDCLHQWSWGDFHVGNRGFCEKTFLRDRERIKNDPLARVILTGDPCDFIAPTDKRADADSVDPEFLLKGADFFQAQIDRVCDYLRPIVIQDVPKANMTYRTVQARKEEVKIKGRREPVSVSISDVVTKEVEIGKVWALLESNHSLTAKKRFYNDVSRRVAETLNVPLWNYSALGHVNFSARGNPKHKFQLKIFGHHGFGAGRKRGAKVNRLDDVSGFFDADLCVMGHVHEIMAWDSPSLKVVRKDGAPRIQERPRKCVLAGTYLRTYTEGFTGYGEMACYSPTSLGTKPVAVRWDRDRNERYLVLE